MSGIIIAVLVTVALVVAVGLWVYLHLGAISRCPSELVVLPPERQTFPNELAFLHFYMTYDSDSSIFPDPKVFTASAVNPAIFVWFSVPDNAKLTCIMLFYGENNYSLARSYNKTFWPRAVQLPDSVKNAQAITLQFSVPGDKRGTLRHFRLV